MKIKAILGAAATVMGMAFSQAASVLISNHSFENGAGVPTPGNWNNNNPEGWTVDESGGQIGLQADNPSPAGVAGAVFTFVQGDASSLSQDILGGTGSSAAVGDVFVLTMAALNQNASPSFDFDITDFSGASLIGGPQSTAVAGDWSDYTVAGTVETPSSEIRLVLNANGPQIRMDNVRLDFQPAAVPEPGSAAMLSIAAFSLMVRRRGRHQEAGRSHSI